MKSNFLFTFLLLILTFKVQAAPDISVKFKSFMRANEVNFTTYRMIVLKIKVAGLKPGEKNLLELKYGFANQKQRKKTFKENADANGVVEITELISLLKFYQRNGGKDESAKLFSAFVFLQDPTQKDITIAKKWSDLLVMPKGQKNIYRINSEVLCQWQGDARIDSEYFSNDEDVNKNITRTSSVTIRKGIRMDLGTESAAGSVTPIPGNGSPFGTSIFIGAEFSKISEVKENFDIEQSWGLVPGQGGFIIRKTTYSRYNAIKYEKEDGEYVPKEEGILDVGLDAVNFAVVPRRLAGNPVESLGFIDKMIPKVDSCRTTFAQNIANYVIENNDSQVLYIPFGELK